MPPISRQWKNNWVCSKLGFNALLGLSIGPLIEGLSREQRDWGSVLKWERHSLREGAKGGCAAVCQQNDKLKFVVKNRLRITQAVFQRIVGIAITLLKKLPITAYTQGKNRR